MKCKNYIDNMIKPNAKYNLALIIMTIHYDTHATANNER